MALYDRALELLQGCEAAILATRGQRDKAEDKALTWEEVAGGLAEAADATQLAFAAYVVRDPKIRDAFAGLRAALAAYNKAKEER